MIELVLEESREGIDTRKCVSDRLICIDVTDLISLDVEISYWPGHAVWPGKTRKIDICCVAFAKVVAEAGAVLIEHAREVLLEHVLELLEGHLTQT